MASSPEENVRMYAIGDNTLINTGMKNAVIRFDEKLGIQAMYKIQISDANGTKTAVRNRFVKVLPGALPLIAGINDAHVYLP